MRRSNPMAIAGSRSGAIAIAGGVLLAFAWSGPSGLDRRARAAAARDAVDQPAGVDTDSVVGLLELVIDSDPDSARRCLGALHAKLLSGEVDARSAERLRERLAPIVAPALADSGHALHRASAFLAATWGDAGALTRIREWAERADGTDAERGDAFAVLMFSNDSAAIELANKALRAPETSSALRARVLEELARRRGAETGAMVLSAWPDLPADARPRAIELLTQRAEWARGLLARIEEGTIDRNELGTHHLLRLRAHADPGLATSVGRLFGTVRATRDPQRESVIRDVRALVLAQPGDPHRGWDVFRRICGQCHRIHGEGQDVGPDITVNGRASLDQLLSNVLDPSLVIGTAYQASVVVTTEGRVLTGLVAEQGSTRTVLKLQGGKTEIVPADAIESMRTSPISLMPEGIEQQLTRRELVDLFAFLRLDKPPTDPSARLLPDSDTAQ